MTTYFSRLCLFPSIIIEPLKTLVLYLIIEKILFYFYFVLRFHKYDPKQVSVNSKETHCGKHVLLKNNYYHRTTLFEVSTIKNSNLFFLH